MLTRFRTHTGEIVEGQRLCDAMHAVARKWARLGRAEYAENCYASHVTESEKLANVRRALITAHRIRTGRETGWWMWQMINEALTGECIALLP